MQLDLIKLTSAEDKLKSLDFLAKNGVTADTKDNFKIIKNGDEIKIFKLIDSIIIK